MALEGVLAPSTMESTNGAMNTKEQCQLNIPNVHDKIALALPLALPIIGRLTEP